MKSSQSNFKLRSPSSYLVRSYLITTVNESTFFQKLAPSNLLIYCTLLEINFNTVLREKELESKWKSIKVSNFWFGQEF